MSSPVLSTPQTNNAKYVSLIAENGTEFNPRQKIVFNLDPSLGWIKARDSYFVIDILNTSSTQLRLSLGKAGISSIVRQVNIYSKQTGILLESLNNYNQWVACEMEYTNDDPTLLADIEGVPQPLSSHMGFTDAQVASRQYEVNLPNARVDFTHASNNSFSPISSTGVLAKTSVRYCMPLRCGIFRHWDDEKLVPILQLGGLRIELILDEVFNSVGLPQASNRMRTSLSCNSPGWEVVGLGPVADTIAVAATTVTFTGDISGKDMGIKECGMCVGSVIQINGTLNGVINQTHSTTVTALAETVDANTGEKALTVTIGDAIPAGGDSSGMVTGTVNLNPSELLGANYKITNIEMRCLQESPMSPDLKNMKYVFTSYDVFNDNVPQTPLRHNQDVTSVASKAKAIFTSYEDPRHSNALSSLDMNSYYLGVTPSQIGVNMNEVVYFINNKLYPLRAYNPQVTADKVINQNELVKAFGAINKRVKSLGATNGTNQDCYTNKYLHARELARGDAVFDLRNAEPQIRIGFSAARTFDWRNTAFTNLTMTTLVFSKRVINIDGETGLTIEF